MKNKNIYWIIGMIYIIFPDMVNAATKKKDNDECLLCDVAIGIGVAICDEIPACQAFLTIASVIILFTAVILFICGGKDVRREMMNELPSCKSLAATSAGYGATKLVLKRR